MTVADAYRRLGGLLSDLEARGVEVREVDPGQVEADDSFVVDLRIEIPSTADAPDPVPADGPGRVMEGSGGGGSAQPPRDGTQKQTDPDSTGRTPDDGPEPGEPESEDAAGPDAAGENEGNSGAAGGEGAGNDDMAAQDEQRAATAPEDGGGDAARDGDTNGGGDAACDVCGEAVSSSARLTVHRLVEHASPDEPLYKHEPALRAAYEGYDSFPAMTAALGVDVTSQTVRRSMMELGIHQPSRRSAPAEDGGSGDEAADASDPNETVDAADPDEAADEPAEPAVDTHEEVEGGADKAGSVDVSDGTDEAGDGEAVTDGSGTVRTVAGDTPGGPDTAESDGATGGSSALGGPKGSDTVGNGAPDSSERDRQATDSLPDGVTVDALRDGIVEGGSLRAVAQRLDRSRPETRELLRERGLLSLVHGRVATRPGREERAEAFEAWLAESGGGADD
jgi:hypothetical protein